MTSEDVKGKILSAIRQSLEGMEDKQEAARHISGAIAIGLTTALRLSELVDKPEYLQLMQAISDRVELEH